MKREKISVSPSFLLLVIFLFWQSRPWEVLLFLSAVLLHEGGHFLALLLCKALPNQISFSFSGASLITAAPYLSYKKEMWVFLAGPIAGGVGCVFSFFLLRWHFTKGAMLFFSFNLLLSLLNLFPVKGLDGAGALRALLCLHGEEYQAEQILAFLHGLSLALLLVLSLWLWKKQGNASLFLLSLSLMGEGTKKRKKATNQS